MVDLVEQAISELRKVGREYSYPISWIKAENPLEKLAEISLSGERDLVMAKPRRFYLLPVSVRQLGIAFRGFEIALSKPDMAYISEYKSLIPILVASHDRAIYLQACYIFAKVLTQESVDEFHRLSQDLLGENARVRRYDNDLSSALTVVVPIFDHANLKASGLREPVKNF